MKVSYLKLILITMVSMIILILLLDNVFIAGIINFVVLFFGYYLIFFLKASNYINLKDEKCDPLKFLEANEKIKKMAEKYPKIKFISDINQAVGFILLGEFEKAKEILLMIDKTDIFKSSINILTYNINLITCLYELGETPKAEEIYESEISTLPTDNKRINKISEIIKAERLYFLNRLEESKEKFHQIQIVKHSKRSRIEILYRLAQIDEKMGNTELANAQYAEVAEKGNELWIAKQAKIKLEMYKKI